MPLIRLDPTSEGTDTGWSLVAGANKTAAVTWPDDDNTTRIGSSFNTGALQSFNMTDLPASAITVVTHQARLRHWSQSMPEGDEQPSLYTLWGGVRNHSGVFGPFGSWSTSTANDLGGATPSVANVNAGQVGCRDNGTGDDGGGGGNIEVSTISWDVTYTVSEGGGWTCVIEGLGPMIAVGLEVLSSRLFRSELWLKARTVLLAHEREEAWRSIREWRHPRHFDLGDRPSKRGVQSWQMNGKAGLWMRPAASLAP